MTENEGHLFNAHTAIIRKDPLFLLKNEHGKLHFCFSKRIMLLKYSIIKISHPIVFISKGGGGEQTNSRWHAGVVLKQNINRFYFRSLPFEEVILSYLSLNRTKGFVTMYIMCHLTRLLRPMGVYLPQWGVWLQIFSRFIL